MQRPEWIITYAHDLQLDENWADSVIDKYDSDIPPQYPHRIVPIDIDQLRTDTFFMNEVRTAEDQSIITASLIYLDLLNSFTNNIPENDAELYELFNRIDNQYTIQIDFPEFYAYCRKLEHIRIPTVPDYEILQTINETKVLQKSVPKNSIWKIDYKNTILKVEVVDFVDPMQLENILDQNILAEVYEPTETYTEGEMIHIKPKHINTGEQLD